MMTRCARATGVASQARSRNCCQRRMKNSSRRASSVGLQSPGSTTAMTFGGGVLGSGFDLLGLGEGGLSVISMQESNQERYDQRYYLSSQHHDRPTHAACRH